MIVLGWLKFARALLAHPSRLSFVILLADDLIYKGVGFNPVLSK
jgi:hypothetical protein